MALIYAVEDDKNILEIEMFALKNSGYQVEGFECARDFYKKLEEKQPDLALLDIMLPDEDGLEIVAKLRRRPETKKLPIIMVTAKSTEIDKVKGLDVGADAQRVAERIDIVLDILVAGDYHSAIHNLEILKAELLRQVAESTPDIPKAPWEI